LIEKRLIPFADALAELLAEDYLKREKSMGHLEQHYHKVGIDYVQKLKDGIIIGWYCDGVGFGQLTFTEKDGELKIDDESMSAGFIIAVLKKISKGFPDMPTIEELMERQKKNDKPKTS